MKKNIFLALTLMSVTFAKAQNSCNYDTPRINNNTTLTTPDSVGLTIRNAYRPNLISNSSNNPNFPNVEYVYTYENQFVGTGSNDEDLQIVGTSSNGFFIPNTLTRNNVSIEIGDELRAFAVGFDLNQFKRIIDTIQTGSNRSTSCKNVMDLIVPNIGNVLSTLGYNNGNDVTNFEDVLRILEIYNNESQPASISKIDDLLSNFNQASSFLGGGCGATLYPMCIKIDANNFHSYLVTNKTVNPDEETISTVAMDEFEIQNDISVYPNPNNGKFILDLNTPLENASVTISNVIGQIIYSRKFSSLKSESFEILNAEGIYFIEINHNNSKIIKRVVKQ